MDLAEWGHMREVLAATFKKRTRDEWVALLQDTDACFAPVLDFDEAKNHPHLQSRGTLIDIDGVVQPAPGPRFSRTPAARPEAPSEPGLDTASAALSAWLDPAALLAYQNRDTFA
jgi:alpha-methylacyl-CoA racemase